MSKCFVCGGKLHPDQEWRLNPKYVAGTTVTSIEGDEYGHKDCVEGDTDE